MSRKFAAFSIVVLFVVATLVLQNRAERAEETSHSDPSQLALTAQLEMKGLEAAVRLVRDSEHIPHIFARTDHDGYFMLGYVHAQDRFFQMDVSRRTFSGTLAELVGEVALAQDIQLRTLGLRRSAGESLSVYPAQTQALLQAYADGVNAFLERDGFQLPPEYAELELSSVQLWSVIDTLTIAKGLAFNLSFDIGDMGRSLTLAAFEAAGPDAGFDGTALFFNDLFRTAPFDSTLSIDPEGGSSSFFLKSTPDSANGAIEASSNPRWAISPAALNLAARYLEKIRSIPVLHSMLSASRRSSGSNWWVIGGAYTESGNPYLANDPHLSLRYPSIFYEAHLTVADDPANGPMNVNGVTFAGGPSFAQGCNTRICWGSTVNPMDVTDVYQEQLIVDFATLTPTATLFGTQLEPVVTIQETFSVNQVGNGTLDDLAEADVGPLEGGLTVLVPRRNNGPIVEVDISQLPTITGLSVQYTGWGPTRELECFRRFARARSVEDFKEALQFFDFGSQNWAYADIDGNIAYFTSAEMPVREDLQLLGFPDGGVSPYFIRDGTHALQHEWLPVQNRQPVQSVNFEILPFAEMPQAINPPSGFIANANNDPIGTSLDNNPLNQLRPGGGIFYLSPGYTSPRIGRIRRLLDGILLTDEREINLEDMRRIQSNNQLLDAEVFTPFLLTAFGNAQAPDAPEELTTLGADPGVAGAIGRLGAWDFSTPTGIQEGYDPGDDWQNLPQPSAEEIQNSVAATIYSLWRSRIIANTIDTALDGLGLSGFGPDSERSLSALRNLLDNFDANQGVGASGVNFFQVAEVESPQPARDTLLLRSLKEALDLLAGDEFAPAFGNSTDQDDYRWGRLHRIVFSHPLGSDPFDVPNGGGFSDLAPALPGVARPGGFEVVDASRHSARADGLNEFMFGSGPARRFVGEVDPVGINAQQVIPGGQSGVITSPSYSGQLGRWLTNGFHLMRLTRQQVESDLVSDMLLSPPDFHLYFPFYQGDAGFFTAFAAANLLDVLSNLEFTARLADGSPAPFESNPSQKALDPANQLARLGSEIFGHPIKTPQSGWVEMKVDPAAGAVSLEPFTASFSQFGGFDLNRLDGSSALHTQSRRLIFTRVIHGVGSFRGHDATTTLFIANPNPDPVSVQLLLRFPIDGGAAGGGSPPPSLRSFTIDPMGVLSESISGLYGNVGSLALSDGYHVEVIVTEGRGVVGFELIQLDDESTAIGLNASFGSGVNVSHSAQLASSPDVFTSVNLINGSDSSRTVRLEAVPEGGGAVREFGPFELQAHQQFTMDASDLLPAPSGSLGQTLTLIGSLNVIASGPGIVGDVLFGDPDQVDFAAALQLQTLPFTEAVFGHVANLEGFFTGLALYFPGTGAPSPQGTGSEEATVTIEVFGSDGQLTGMGQLGLDVGDRTSRTLVELVPESAGQAGGYIVVTSDRPIIGQELFGTLNLSLQSAVPPTAVRQPGF